MTTASIGCLSPGITDYAIYMLDLDGRVVNWNAGAERFKGYTAQEIVGHHFSRFYTEADRASGLPEHALHTAATEGKFETEGWRVRKDGTTFWATCGDRPDPRSGWGAGRFRQDHPRP